MAASAPATRPTGQAGPRKPGERPEEEGGVDLDERAETKKPRRYRVVFHNDDYTTMEFVVYVLTTIFLKSETEATHVMLTVHRKGSAVAGVYPRDVAETKVERTMTLARENGMPLLVTAEPE